MKGFEIMENKKLIESIYILKGTLTEEEYKDNFELFKTVNLCETDEDLLEQYSEKELREKFLQRKAKKLIEENATIVAPTEAPEQQ